MRKQKTKVGKLSVEVLTNFPINSKELLTKKQISQRLQSNPGTRELGRALKKMVETGHLKKHPETGVYARQRTTVLS